MVGDITIRRFGAEDSIDELTTLLHRAYAQLGAMGLNYTAVDQSAETTRERIGEGECLIAVRDERLIGTVLFQRQIRNTGSPWLTRPDVAHLGQFGVEPVLQRQGLGARLMDAAEARARETGAAEIALDTAEPATHLVSWYSRRGYRFVEHAHWKGKTYRSLIMSKTL